MFLRSRTGCAEATSRFWISRALTIIGQREAGDVLHASAFFDAMGAAWPTT